MNADNKGRSDAMPASPSTERLRRLLDFSDTSASFATGLFRYKMFFDKASEAFMVFRLEEDGEPGRFFEVNRAATELLGYTEEELLCMTPKDIEAESFTPRPPVIGHHIRTVGRAVFNVASRAKDGRLVHLEVSSHTFDTDGGAVVLAIARDLTALKDRDKALAESEAKLQNLFNNTHDPIIIYDLEERHFQDANPAALALYGYDLDEFKTLSMEDIFVETEDTEKLIEMLCANQCPLEIGSRMHRNKDGSAFPVDLTANIVSYGEKKLLGAIVRDMSLYRQWEERLVQARKDAEAASRAKSEFLTCLSHELRTPLNGMLGVLQLLRDMELTDEQKRFAGKGLEAGRGLLSLLNNMLDIAELEAGGGDVACIPFVPEHLIRETLGMLEHQAREKGLAVFVEANGLPNALNGDPTRLRQVLFNLIANAVKFTESGEVRVEAGIVDPLPTGGATLAVTVSDTGPGIPEDQMGRLLEEPFTQADQSHTRKHGGTGLGLTVARRLSRIMGGDVALSNRPQGGLEVRLRVEVQVPKASPHGG